MTFLASLLLGAMLGAANAVAAVGTARRALTLAPTPGMQLVLKAMGLRLALTLGAFAIVIAFAPVHQGAFVTGLGVLVACGMAAEAALVLNRPPADASS